MKLHAFLCSALIFLGAAALPMPLKVDVDIEPDGGSYPEEPLPVSFDLDDGAKVYFTLDGTEPKVDKKYLYKKPVTLNQDAKIKTTIVRYIVERKNGTTLPVESETYVFNDDLYFSEFNNPSIAEGEVFTLTVANLPPHYSFDFDDYKDFVFEKKPVLQMQYPDKFSNNKIKKMALKVVDFKPKSKSVNVLCTSTVQLYNTKEYNKFIKTGYPTYSYLVNNPSERENVRGKIYIKLNDKDYPFGNQSIPMQPYAFYRQPGIYSTVPFELAIDLKASPSEAKIYNVSGIHWGKSVPKCWLETIYKDKVKKYALKAKGGLSSPNPYTKSTVTDKDGYSFIRVTIPKNFDPQTSSESFRFVINAGKGLDTRRAYIK